MLDSLATTNPATQPAVYAAGLGRVVKVIGPLGEPLGKVIVIEGILVPDNRRNNTYWDANMAGILFAVDTIDHKKLDFTPRISLALPPKHAPLEQGKRYVFTGYQNGEFLYEPREAAIIQHGFPDQADWRFGSFFAVIEADR